MEDITHGFDILCRWLLATVDNRVGLALTPSDDLCETPHAAKDTDDFPTESVLFRHYVAPPSIFNCGLPFVYDGNLSHRKTNVNSL